MRMLSPSAAGTNQLPITDKRPEPLEILKKEKALFATSCLAQRGPPRACPASAAQGPSQRGRQGPEGGALAAGNTGNASGADSEDRKLVEERASGCEERRDWRGDDAAEAIGRETRPGEEEEIQPMKGSCRRGGRRVPSAAAAAAVPGRRPGSPPAPAPRRRFASRLVSQPRKGSSVPSRSPGFPTPCTLNPAAAERRGHGGAEEERAAAGQRRALGGEGAGEEAATRRRGRGARWQLLSPAGAEQPRAVAGQAVRLGRGSRRRCIPARRDEHGGRRGHHFLRAALRPLGVLHHPRGRHLQEGRSGGDRRGRGAPAATAAAGQLLERGERRCPWHRVSRGHLRKQCHPVPGQLWWWRQPTDHGGICDQ
ncbi:CLK4-associating serine/arginine rich protein-like [Cebus imitator]|uniref:CLK4-associating serine/arginine rich protein-like n=1 Tax=Cebus imitator TaxID=2715852 RepID=UPI0018973DDD|nr:CLK4-associating serine/arginine rich protein-like [Cebus imitator]